MDELSLDRDGGVATITINRPRVKNALTPHMFAELRDICRALNEDDDCRVVVITGEGGDFCSGADVSGIGNNVTRHNHQLRSMREIGEAVLALHELQHPVVAKVRGVAAGAGLGLALGCDLAYAADTARLSAIFARRGLSVDFGCSWLLPQLIGLQRAKELAFLAEVLPVAVVHDMGLLNRVVPEAELDDVVDDVVSRLALGPPLALSMTKKLLNNGLTSTMAEAVEAESLAQTVTFRTSDAAEAMEAFVEKRDPEFRGR